MFQYHNSVDLDGVHLTKAELIGVPVLRGHVKSVSVADGLVDDWYKKVAVDGGCFFRYQPSSRSSKPEKGPGGILMYSMTPVESELFLFPEISRKAIVSLLRAVGFMQPWPADRVEQVSAFLEEMLIENIALVPAAVGERYVILYSTTPQVVTKEMVLATQTINRKVCGVVKSKGELADESSNSIGKSYLTIGEI